MRPHCIVEVSGLEKPAGAAIGADLIMFIHMRARMPRSSLARVAHIYYNASLHA